MMMKKIANVVSYYENDSEKEEENTLEEEPLDPKEDKTWEIINHPRVE
jgi:hypothetical protein